MGINELDPSGKQWGAQAPKKKWKHWYMSFGDDQKASSECKKQEAESHSVAFKSSSHKATMASLDVLSPPLSASPDAPRRASALSSPLPKEPDDSPPNLGVYRRGSSIALGYTAAAVVPVASSVRSTPIQVPQQAFYSSPHEASFSTSPCISPSNSSSGDSISSLGLVSAFRNNSASAQEGPSLSYSNGSRRSLEASSQISSPVFEGTNSQYQTNGFIRPINSLQCGKAGSVPASLDQEDDSNNDAKEEIVKKRAGSTPSREVHNKLEKNRRAHLKECFESLRRQLPSMEDKKISNQTILKAAHRYIQNLKRKEKEYEHEMERLAREKIAHQQQLSSLKKELQTKWDHLDFSKLLPDMSSLDQHREKDTKSTTTASEQPDLEEDSRDSLRLTSVNHTPECPPGGAYLQLAPSHAEDLKPQLSTSDRTSFHHVERETYLDPNQPLNLSTNTPVGGRSPRRNPSPPSDHLPQIRTNGEWPTRRHSPYSLNYPHEKSTPKMANSVNKMSSSSSPAVINVVNKLSDPNLGLNVTRISPLSTNSSHINSPMDSVPFSSSSVVTTLNTGTVTNLSQIVKGGSTMSHIPSITKVVTTLPHMSALTPVGTTISTIPSTPASNLGQIHIASSESTNVPNAVPVRATVAHIANGGAAIARVSSTALTGVNTTVTVASAEHPIPIVGGSGIQLPAHLVTNGVHLTGATGSIISQPAIQVITPEGYKLIPAEHAHNGVKPVAFALAQPGLEHLSNVEDGKHAAPLMVAVNKNGLSALHLTVPATARAITSNSPGNSVPATSVPLNLSVPGSAQAVKVTQTGSAPLISSYIPLTHANGLTRLVPGMSVVGPLVVSQSQRGGVVVPANISATGTKGLKAQGSSPGTGVVVSTTAGGGGTATLPLAQYATTLTGGLVNSVVVVSASTAGPAVTSSMTLSTAKN